MMIQVISKTDFIYTSIGNNYNFARRSAPPPWKGVGGMKGYSTMLDY